MRKYDRSSEAWLNALSLIYSQLTRIRVLHASQAQALSVATTYLALLEYLG